MAQCYGINGNRSSFCRYFLASDITVIVQELYASYWRLLVVNKMRKEEDNRVSLRVLTGGRGSSADCIQWFYNTRTGR